MTHRSDQRSKAAQEYRRWYYTNTWKRLRSMVLARDPICQMCGKQPSTVADHIVPHRGNRELFFDMDNLQGVDKSCHDSHKQRLEQRGYSGDVDVTGWPVDPYHPVNRGR